MPSPFTKQYNL